MPVLSPWTHASVVENLSPRCYTDTFGGTAPISLIVVNPGKSC